MSNFHATDARGRNFPTKKSLREAVANDEHVDFTDTSAFSNRGILQASDLSASDVIVGPDPYTKRDWYANVKIKAGKLVVV